MADFEEKYLVLRDEHIALKKKKNEQDATIKRMQTKLAMIEEHMKKRDGNQVDASVKPSPIREKATDTFVNELKRENGFLKKKNKRLLERNRQLKEELSRKTTKGTRTSSTMRSGPDTGAKQTRGNRPLHHDVNVAELETALKQRLVTAERQLVKLQKENARLRGDNNQGHSSTEAVDSDNNNCYDSDWNNDKKMNVEQLRRELRDRQAQLSIITARYENTEMNAAAEREIHEKTLEEMESMNRQVHKLRTQVHNLEVEKEDWQVKIARLPDVEKECSALKKENKKLEDDMKSLCESPFINDAYQRKERLEKLRKLEVLTQEQQETITSLKEDNANLKSKGQDLENNIKYLQSMKASSDAEIERLKRDLEREEQHRLRLQEELDKLRKLGSLTPRNNPDPIKPEPPMPSIGKETRDMASSPVKTKPNAPSSFGIPITVMTRTYDSDLDPLQAADESLDDADHDVRHLRNRIHVLQVAHLKALKESERCEQMLEAQAEINRELGKEVEELTQKKLSTMDALLSKAKKAERLADEQKQQIQQLEAQIRQLKYARHRLLKRLEQTGEIENSSSEDEGDDVSISESLVLAARDLAPGEQLLEVYVIDATLDTTIVGANASTFLLWDFYDFESQATPLAVGSRPKFNFASTFKITVDSFFLRYLASETLSFELHQSIKGDFRLVGQAHLRLASLLKNRGTMKDSALAIHSTKPAQKEKLGSLHVVVRLSMPISEIWRIHVQSYPQDSELIESKDIDCYPSLADFEKVFATDEDIHPKNEIQITVFGCRHLKSKHYKEQKPSPPSSYVHYQLLGHRDSFTNIVPETSRPEYDLDTSKQFFDVEVDGTLLHFLSKFCLWLTVFDDKAEITSDCSGSDSVIGRCGLHLKDLTQGESVRGWFQLTSEDDQPAGEISVLIQWKDPFQVLQVANGNISTKSNGLREPEMHTLNFDQQHALLTMFDAIADSRINYRQFLLYALPPDALELLSAKIKDALDHAIDGGQIKTVVEAFGIEETVSLRGRKLSLEKLLHDFETYGIFLSDNDVSLLRHHFATESTKVHQDNEAVETNPFDSCDLDVHFLHIHINPRASCASRLLRHKVSHTMRRYLMELQEDNSEARVLSPDELFARQDFDGTGNVSRGRFKRCLTALGFALLDVDEQYEDYLRKQQAAAMRGEDPMKDTSDVELDEEPLKADDEKERAGTEVRTEDDVMFDGASNVGAKNVPNNEASGEEPSTIDPAYAALADFERRRQEFHKRMQSLAARNNRSAVYNSLLQQSQQNNQQGNSRAPVCSLTKKHQSPLDVLSHRLSKLQAPTSLHEDAAKTVQRSYRQHYQQLRNTHRQMQSVEIIAADTQLQTLLSGWSIAELQELNMEVLEHIESNLPQDEVGKPISRKLFIYAISQVPRLALPPELLQKLMNYFSVRSTDPAAPVSYRALNRFICTSVREGKETFNAKLKPLLQCLAKVTLDTSHIIDTLAKVGDFSNKGRISIGKLREAVHRLQLPWKEKDLQLLVVLFDWNGYEVLYHLVLHTLRNMEHSQKLQLALSKCARVGVSTLRDQLLLYVDTKDGQFTQEKLKEVLLKQSACQFTKEDSTLLYQMLDPGLLSSSLPIQSFILRLERALKWEKEANVYLANKYSLQMLQRIGWNLRRVACPPFSEMKVAYERFDWRERGIVSLQEFMTTTKHIGFSLYTNRQIELLGKAFGAKVDGQFGINYMKFLEWTTPIQGRTVFEIEDQVRKVALNQANQTSGLQLTDVLSIWRKAFQTIDKKNSGYISRSQFVFACTDQLQLPLSDLDMQVVLHAYDPRLEDAIGYNAFLRLDYKQFVQGTSRGSANSSAQVDGSKVISEIQHKLDVLRVPPDRLLEAFNNYTNKQSNLMEGPYFLLCLKSLGIVLSEEEVRAVFALHGKKPNYQTLDATLFLENVLGCNPPPKKQETRTWSEADEERLCKALSFIVEAAFDEYRQAIRRFREFCEVYDFRDVRVSKLWKKMEKCGLVRVISKHTTGILVQKFAKESDNEDDVDERLVNLEDLFAYLRLYLTVQIERARYPNNEKHESVTNEVEEQKPRTPAKPPAVKSPSHSPNLNMDPQVPKPIADVQVSTDVRELLGELLGNLERNGIDLRSRFEEQDPSYTGYCSALDIREIITASDVLQHIKWKAPDQVIGILVRQYRISDEQDAVDYISMINEAVFAISPSTSHMVPDALVESIRYRIRRKAELDGSLIYVGSSVYKQLDAAFKHFDENDNGLLSRGNVAGGLAALNYDISEAQAITIFRQMSMMRLENNTLTRTEFDCFVLAPYAFLTLNRLAVELFSASGDCSGHPKVARLSQLIKEYDDLPQEGIISTSTMWTFMEQSLGRSLHASSRRALRHLFDVRRDGNFAYRLFLKALAQYKQPEENQAAEVMPFPLSPAEKAGTESRQVPQIRKQDIIRALYSQLCSVDFLSQLEILEEYLTRQDSERYGVIFKDKMALVFKHVGLKLSSDAITALVSYYPPQSLHLNFKMKAIQYQSMLNDLRSYHDAVIED